MTRLGEPVVLKLSNFCTAHIDSAHRTKNRTRLERIPWSNGSRLLNQIVLSRRCGHFDLAAFIFALYPLLPDPCQLNNSRMEKPTLKATAPSLSPISSSPSPSRSVWMFAFRYSSLRRPNDREDGRCLVHDIRSTALAKAVRLCLTMTSRSSETAVSLSVACKFA